MKNIKFSKVLPLVAVIAAVGAAIVPAHKSGAQGASTGDLYWFAENGTYDGFHSQSAEINQRGCNANTTKVCARGFSQQQLSDQDVPEAGPLNVNNNSGVIYKQ